MKEAKVGDRVRVLGLPVHNAAKGTYKYDKKYYARIIGTVTEICKDVGYSWARLDNGLAYFLSDLKIIEEKKQNTSCSRASITYKKLEENRYQILDWKVDDVNTWPEDVQKLYLSATPYFWCFDGNLNIVTRVSDIRAKYYKGIILSREEFSSLISTLKAAGARLSQIKKEYKSTEVKTILI